MPMKQRPYQKSVINQRLPVLVYTMEVMEDFFEEWRSFSQDERDFFNPEYVKQVVKMFTLMTYGFKNGKGKGDWLDEYFEDYNSLTPEEKENVRREHAAKTGETFKRRAYGLLSFPDLRPKNKT